MLYGPRFPTHIHCAGLGLYHWASLPNVTLPDENPSQTSISNIGHGRTRIYSWFQGREKFTNDVP